MTIIRVKKTKKFSIVANRPFDTKKLSWEARGVMGYLLTKPNDWEVKQYDLEQQGPAGKHKISRIVNELISAGFITRIKYQDDKGHWQWRTEVFEDMIANPETRKPDLGKPDLGKPDVGKPDNIIKTDPIKTDPIKTEGKTPSPNSFPLIDSPFLLKVKSLIGWTIPLDEMSADNRRQLADFDRWLKYRKATPQDLEKASDYFSWMQNSPTMKQIKNDWPAVKSHTIKANGASKNGQSSKNRKSDSQDEREAHLQEVNAMLEAAGIN